MERQERKKGKWDSDSDDDNKKEYTENKDKVKKEGWSGYYIADTDYDTYAVTYACQNAWFDTAKNEYITIYSREKTMTDAKLTDIKNKIKAKYPEYDVDKAFIMVDQGDGCVHDRTVKPINK